ncbi:MAG: FtsX-like permease family protein [Pseudomonadota bacterium]|nr:FtsX-like permease family protein [Pseudomonadota bacterium]
MWNYYFKLGLMSLRRNPILTSLMVLILGFGVGASMTAYTVMHVLGGDPIPHKSGKMFVPQLDTGSAEDYKAGDEPDLQLGYLDTDAMLRARHGSNRTAVYGIAPIVDAQRKDLPPSGEAGLAMTRGFFEMFELPFRFGGPWNAAEDDAGSDVVVIGRVLSEKLFGAEDPSGRSVRLADRDYRIVGVLDLWRPVPRYYRLLSGSSPTESEQVMVPFRNAISREWRNDGWTNCNGSSPDEPGFAGFLKRECNWIQYWVQLNDAAAVAEYRDYLAAHLAQQRKLGRFKRPDNIRLRDVREWLAFNDVVDADTRLQTYLAFGFLLVCIVNVVGLLLAKFTARSGEIGVRRALGATRGNIISQYLVETVVIGLAGALLGLALSYAGLLVVDHYSFESAGIAKHDPWMVAATVAVAIVSAVLAGLLPTWRAALQVPALQLKSQ